MKFFEENRVDIIKGIGYSMCTCSLLVLLGGSFFALVPALLVLGFSLVHNPIGQADPVFSINRLLVVENVAIFGGLVMLAGYAGFAA